MTQKIHKDARDELVLFILLKKCWNLVLFNRFEIDLILFPIQSLKL